ncbi:MAG: phage head spike fiber domain-containing protein, partial [Bdellovibrio sp.]
SLKANGGTNVNNGGGAGGRIAVVYTTDSYTGGISNLTAQAFGGDGGGTYGDGGAGTIFYKHTGVDTFGRLIIANNNYTTNVTPNNYSTTPWPAELSGISPDTLTVGGGSIIEVQTGITLNLPTTGTLNFPVYLNGGTLGNMPNNDLTITSSGVLWLPGSGTQTFHNLTVAGLISQFNFNSTTAVYKLNLAVSNNLDLQASGKIDVSYRGYNGGGPGSPIAANSVSGGGHGGVGGWSGGSIFDSVTNPTDLGGSSGSYYYVAGGGAAIITVGNNLTLNGSIIANGNVSNGAGAGGTINITTNQISGTSGSLKANGGTGANNGGGGGGRIAVVYTTDSYSGGISSLTAQAFGGTGGNGNGGDGTIYISPTLNLNLTTGTLPAIINFSRSSVGSYYDASGVLVFATNNQPRFDFKPSDYSSLGLLIEPQRSNQLLYSEDLSQAFWTKQNLTLSTSSTAPDGLSTPYKIEETAATGYHAIQVNQSLTANQDYVLSFYAKAIERSWVAVNTLDLSGISLDSYVNLTSGAVGTVQHSNVTVQPINNGWYRVFVKFNAASGVTSPTLSIGTGSADTVKSYAGVVGSGVYIWGIQLEAGKYGTSYINTNGAIQTRSADVATVTDLTWFVSGTSSLGTFVLDVQVPFLDYSMPFMQLDNGSSSSSHRIGINSSTYSTQYIMQEAATTYANITNGSWSNADHKKVCATFKTGVASLSTGGIAVTKGTPTTMPSTGLSTLRLGADQVGTSFSGHILSVKYMRNNFTDETCKQVSQ